MFLYLLITGVLIINHLIIKCTKHTNQISKEKKLQKWLLLYKDSKPS